MNTKYLSTDLTSAPLTIHDYATPKAQTAAVKVTDYFNKQLNNLSTTVTSPNASSNQTVQALQSIAPDGNAQTGLKMVQNTVNAESMLLPTARTVQSTVDIGGVAHYQAQQKALSVTVGQPNGISASASAQVANNTISAQASVNWGSSSLASVSAQATGPTVTMPSLNDVAKQAGDTFTSRINTVATSISNLDGLTEAQQIFGSSTVASNDYLGLLEEYAQFIKALTSEWLMAGTSQAGPNNMDQMLMCCLVKNVSIVINTPTLAPSSAIDLTKELIDALTNLKGMIQVAQNAVTQVNDFFSFINQLIQSLVSAASAMLVDYFSKFYYMFTIPTVAYIENLIASPLVASKTYASNPNNITMDTALTIHNELESFMSGQSANGATANTQCNIIESLVGGIPLQADDALLAQIIKMLNITAPSLNVQIKVGLLDSVNDILDGVISALTNILQIEETSLNLNVSVCKQYTGGIPPVIPAPTATGGNPSASVVAPAASTNLPGGAYSTPSQYGNSVSTPYSPTSISIGTTVPTTLVVRQPLSPLTTLVSAPTPGQMQSFTLIPYAANDVAQLAASQTTPTMIQTAGTPGTSGTASTTSTTGAAGTSSTSGTSGATSGTQSTINSTVQRILDDAGFFNTTLGYTGTTPLSNSYGETTDVQKTNYVVNLLQNAKIVLANHASLQLSALTGNNVSSSAAFNMIDAKFATAGVSGLAASAPSAMAAYASDISKYADWS